MKVYGKCKNCKNEIDFSTSAHTRVEFAMQNWESKKVECKSCNKSSAFHVDDLFAKPSKVAQILAGLIFLLGTPILYFIINPIFTGSRNHYVIYIVGGSLLIPVLVYAAINKHDQTRVSDFNRRKLKGRVHNIQK